MIPTIAELQAQFPTPRIDTDDDFTLDSYCVGGALCQWVYLENGSNFPDEVELSGALRAANPALDRPDALDYALAIIAANDGGDFPCAWATLARALTAKAPY